MILGRSRWPTLVGLFALSLIVALWLNTSSFFNRAVADSMESLTFKIGATGGTLTGNQKMAQTVNIQDFEIPDASLSCSGSGHDDVPAANRATAYLGSHGGGRLLFPRKGDCWIKSNTFGLTSITYAGDNITLDLNGSTLSTTLNDHGTVFGVGPGALSWGNVHGTLYSFTSVDIGATSVTVASGAGANFAIGDVTYMQTGPVFSGTPFNSEGNVVLAVNGDVLTMRYPVEHKFTYSASPDGIQIMRSPSRGTNVSGTFFGITLENLATSPHFGKTVFSSVLCIHCAFRNLNIDQSNGGIGFETGDSRDVTMDNITLSMTDPAGLQIQFSTGMADTTIQNSHFTCIATSGGSFTQLDFSEGASNSTVEDSVLAGSCSIGASTYQGAHLIRNLFYLNAPGTQAEFSFAGSGTADSTGLDILDNLFVFPNTTPKENIFLTGPLTKFIGNTVTSYAAYGFACVVGTANLASAILSANNISCQSTALLFSGLTTHTFNAAGNFISGPGVGVAGSVGIDVGNDGPMTGPGETIVANTVAGFETGIEIGNLSNESSPILSPNNVAANAIPYSPSSIATDIPGGVITGLNNIQLCASPSGITGAFNLLVDCGTGDTNVQFATPNTGHVALLFGSPGTPSSTSIKYDDGAQQLMLNVAGSGNISMSATGTQFAHTVTAPNITATSSASAFAAGTTIGGVVPGGSFTISNGGACSGGTPHASMVNGSLSGGVLTLTPVCVP